MSKTEIPSGIEHLEWISSIAAFNASKSGDIVADQRDLQVIGTSLSVFYQAATCHRKCYGGGHLLERLVGRIYNLSCAAYLLTTLGFYDESLSLIRIIGEISNLITLSIHDPEAIKEWISSDETTRHKKFSPVKVRMRIEEKGGILLANQDWYSNISNNYIHATPNTQPNMHNKEGISAAGGLIQEEGVEKVIRNLAYITGPTALIVCAYFKFDDLLQELKMFY
ncbi:MAG: hypothetical protein F6K32_22615 [Desertifilum sp. SIO1I2]|nr:hypothetical protein [Desertifilum sp. SIO1I2]